MRKLLLIISLCAVFIGGIMFIHPVMAQSDDSGSSESVNNLVDANQPTAAQQLATRAKSTWPWYVTRASGLVAAVLLSILILSGIGSITGHTFRILEPITAWATHRALGIAFGVAVLLHIISLLFDHFIPFSLVQVLVPFTAKYKPVQLGGWHLGSLYVALGILAFYLLIIVIITSLIWIEKKPQTWKWLHLLSYLVLAFVFIHALFLGTDLAHGLLRYIWIAIGIGVVAAIAVRLRRVGTI